MPRKVILHMYTTLDGIAEAVEYPDETPADNREFWEFMWNGPLADIDTLLLGRKTYEAWAQFWPAMLDSEDEQWRAFARFSTRVEKVVFSRTLESLPWANSRVVRGPVADEVARLRAAPGKNMGVSGGVRFVQSIIAQDLADELCFTVFPTIVGRGRPLFAVKTDPDYPEDIIPAGAPGRHDYRLLESRPFRSGAIFLHYALPARPPPSSPPAPSAGPA